MACYHVSSVYLIDRPCRLSSAIHGAALTRPILYFSLYFIFSLCVFTIISYFFLIFLIIIVMHFSIVCGCAPAQLYNFSKSFISNSRRTYFRPRIRVRICSFIHFNILNPFIFISFNILVLLPFI